MRGDALDVVRVLVEAVHAGVRGVRLCEADGGVGLPRGDKGVHGLDIVHHGDDATGKEEQEGDDDCVLRFPDSPGFRPDDALDLEDSS